MRFDIRKSEALVAMEKASGVEMTFDSSGQ